MAPVSRRRYPGLFGHPDRNQDSQVADSSPLVARRPPALAQKQPVPSQNHGPRQSPAFVRWVPDKELQDRYCRQSSFSPVSGAGSAHNSERRSEVRECDSLDERDFKRRYNDEARSFITLQPTCQQKNQTRYQQARRDIGKGSAGEETCKAENEAANRQRQSHDKHWLLERLIHYSIPFRSLLIHRGAYKSWRV
jgi:hypothetical protein